MGLIAIMAVIIAAGLYVAKYVKGRSLYYILAGRQLPLFLSTATFMGQSIDANVTLGNVQNVVEVGFWAGMALPIGLALTLFITGLLFAERLNQMRLLTLPDFYRRIYDRKVEMLSSTLMIISFGVLLAGNLSSCAFLITSLFGSPYLWSLIMISLLILSYTIAGGLISDALMDVLYVFLVFLGGFGAFFFLAAEFGFGIFGFDPRTAATSIGYSLTQFTLVQHGALINWATIFALGLGDIVALDFMARVFAARSQETARRSCLVAAGGTLLAGVLFGLMGIAALNIFRTSLFTRTGDPVIFDLLFNFIPVPFTILILASIIGSSMSTSDGAILQTSSVITHNIFNVKLKEKLLKGKDKLLVSTRLATLPVLIIGIFVAYILPAPGALLALAFDIVLAGTLVPFVLGFYWKEANVRAAWWAIWIGSLSRIFFFVLTPTIYGHPNTVCYVSNGIFSATWDGFGTLIAPVISLVVYFGVTFLVKRESVGYASESHIHA